MKKYIALLLVLLLAGCSDSSATGIIGGADGPTSIIVAGDKLPQSSSSESEPPPESPPAESSEESKAPTTPESKSEPTPESKPEPKPESKSEAPPASSKSEAAADNAKYSLSTTKVKAGDLLTFTAKDCDLEQSELTIKTTLTGAQRVFQQGEDVVAFVAVSRNIALGDYQVTVSEQGRQVATLPLSVVDAGFASESFEMAQGTVNSTVNSSTAREEYNRITADVMAVGTAKADYPNLDGFVFPLEVSSYRVSSSYGFTRIVNGKVSGRHEGIDFPAPKGTQVVAAGDGKVLYSGLMQMTGNTVIIEHGMGLKSWYHHMDSLDCATGDTLVAGEAVGKVGTTGYSTGNHLHFGMSVFDTYTNPWQFIPKP